MKNRMRHFSALSLFLVVAAPCAFAQALPDKKPAPPVPGSPALPAPPPGNPLTQPQTNEPAYKRPQYLIMVPFPTLESSLQLNPDQSAKIRLICQSVDSSAAALRTAAKTPDDKQNVAAKIKKMENDANQQIFDLLNEEQRKKSPGVIYEMLKMMSIGMPPQMLKEMELTPPQRSQILTLVDNVQTEMKKLPRAEQHGKYAELVKPERLKIPALLTDKQKAVFAKYDDQGKPKIGGTTAVRVDTPPAPTAVPPPPVTTPPNVTPPIKK